MYKRSIKKEINLIIEKWERELIELVEDMAADLASDYPNPEYDDVNFEGNFLYDLSILIAERAEIFNLNDGEPVKEGIALGLECYTIDEDEDDLPF